MASSRSELEQRVTNLETEMGKRKRKLDKLDSAEPWWEQITGTFEDDPRWDMYSRVWQSCPHPT